MNLYKEQRDRQQKRIDDFLRQYGFFAFNREQFDAGLQKLNIQPGEEKVLAPIPCNWYILKSKAAELKTILKEGAEERERAMNDPTTGLQFALDMFLEELANHEFTFTGDEWETLDALGITADDLAKNERLRAALESAKFLLLKRSDELDLLDDLRNLEDEMYFDYGLKSNPGGEKEEELIAAMARQIKADGLADKITDGILDALTAHNYHMVRRAAEMVREPTA